MPLILNASVGFNGRNMPGDVLAVQRILNLLPATVGGPIGRLAEDGLIGPQTIGAIRTFQSKHFSWGDGRIDVNGPTHSKLNALTGSPGNGVNSATGPAVGGVPGNFTLPNGSIDQSGTPMVENDFITKMPVILVKEDRLKLESKAGQVLLHSGGNSVPFRVGWHLNGTATVFTGPGSHAVFVTVDPTPRRVYTIPAQTRLMMISPAKTISPSDLTPSDEGQKWMSKY